MRNVDITPLVNFGTQNPVFLNQLASDTELLQFLQANPSIFAALIPTLEDSASLAAYLPSVLAAFLSASSMTSPSESISVISLLSSLANTTLVTNNPEANPLAALLKDILSNQDEQLPKTESHDPENPDSNEPHIDPPGDPQKQHQQQPIIQPLDSPVSSPGNPESGSQGNQSSSRPHHPSLNGSLSTNFLEKLDSEEMYAAITSKARFGDPDPHSNYQMDLVVAFWEHVDYEQLYIDIQMLYVTPF